MLFPETIFIENTTESTPTKVSDPKDAKEIAKKLIASGVCTQFNYYKNCYLPITILTSVTWNRMKWTVKYFCIINYKKCCKVTFVVSLAVERMFYVLQMFLQALLMMISPVWLQLLIEFKLKKHKIRDILSELQNKQRGALLWSSHNQ